MRVAAKSILSDKARAFPDDNVAGHPAAADAAATPRVVPVCYARLGNRLYFSQGCTNRL